MKSDWYIDERSDPEKATLAAAKYLKTLHGLFDGDWHLVLAAYNGGLGRVQRAMKRSGRTDFWDLAESSRFLPRETREYVPLILAAIIVAKNPAQYGFEIVSEGPVGLRKGHGAPRHRLAKGRGVDGPQHRRYPGPQPGTAPLDDAVEVSEYELKVPVGTAVPVLDTTGIGVADRARGPELVHGQER